MTMMMGKVKMELSKTGWTGWTVMMLPAAGKKRLEKMSFGELLYFALIGESPAM
jgi:hypothetical protein